MNKYLIYHHELGKIPGEKSSDSHAVYSFLKNIHDRDYSSTVLLLKNTNQSLDECINIIRKTERDISNRRAGRRKIGNVVRRTTNQGNKRDRSEYESDFDNGYLSDNR